MLSLYKIKRVKYVIVIVVNFSLILVLGFNNILNFNSIPSPNLANDIDIDLSLLPRENQIQNLQMWTNPQIEMLIVAPPPPSNFSSILQPLANWKTKKGVKTVIATNYSAYEGDDTQEKIRNMIKSYYNSDKIQWVLLAGDTDVIPIRYVYNPDALLAGESEDVGDPYLKPTDYYYAELDGTWDDDGDDKYGESVLYNENGIDEIEWYPEVYVGRFPASNDEELGNMVNKTLKYETNPTVGEWMNSILLAGVISNYPHETKSKIGEDEARLTSYILSNYVSNTMDYTHLIQTTSTYEPNPSFSNISHASFVNNINTGYSVGMFAGHGAPEKMTDRAGSSYYTTSDANGAANSYMPTLFYSSTCDTNTYDVGDGNIGETLIKQKDGGAIGYVGGLRVTWYFEEDDNLEMLNRGNCKLFWREFFINESYQQGKALFDSKIAYLDSEWFSRWSNINMSLEWERKNVLTYSLLGDPEVDIYTAKPKTPQNPFSGNIYEGQSISMRIKSTGDEVLTDVKVHLTNNSGKYRTFHSDESGTINILLPLDPDTYYFTISGHNILPLEGAFQTKPDMTAPIISDNPLMEPLSPTVSDNICFSINASDSESGIENIFLLISNDKFNTYEYSTFTQSSSSSSVHTCTLNKLDFMDYDYAIVGFDYANNSVLIYNSEAFCFQITPPVSFYILIVANFSIFGILGFGVVVFVKTWQAHSKKYKRLEEI